MSTYKLIRITYWKRLDGHAHSIWWFSDQLHEALRAVGAVAWRIG